MKIEELKQGQAVWVKGYVDSSIFGERYGFINFYKKDGNNLGHISKNNVREMKEEDVQIDQPKPVLKKEHAEWLEELKNEFPDNLPNQLYHITRQGWGYGLVFESNAGQKIKISNLDDGKLKKDLVNALIYGYTVEKEKLYTVEIPNPNTISTTALKKSNVGDVVMCYQIDNYWKNNSRYQLTEAEIRKDFEWAWQQGFAKEVTE